MNDPQADLMDRRLFLRRLGGGLLLAGLAAAGWRCGPAGSPAAGSTPLTRRWAWQVRWIGALSQPNPQTWRLRIDGLVQEPLALSLAEVRALPTTTLRLRIKCVECWSAPALWTGVAGRALLALARPLESGRYVTLYALDGYTSTLSREELTAERVLFVWGMDGAELPAQHGFPLRLIAPSKYKCVKAIVRLELTDRRIPGFWERYGYDDVGTIQAGQDHPLDLGGPPRPISGGEITDY